MAERRVIHGQQEMLHADPQTGATEVSDAARNELAVSIVGHDLQELRVLDIFSNLNQLGFVINDRQGRTRRYGSGAANVETNARHKYRELQIEAKETFLQSLGHYALLDALTDYPHLSRRDEINLATRQWNLFQKAYYPARHIADRVDRGRFLRERINFFQTAYNREHGLRPHLSDADRRKQQNQSDPVTTRELPKLSSQQRLQAIQEDPRAGFLPAADKEKTLVMSWLDYLDNPEYPFGVSNQIIEVFNRQSKLRRSDSQQLAQQVTKTLTYEVHGYLLNAQACIESFHALDELLAGVNPKVTLGEEVDIDHPGYRALLRFRDGVRLRETGEVELGIPNGNPLTQREDRRPNPTEPDNHKTLQDIYTQPVLSPFMETYLESTLQTMTVREAMALLPQATQNEYARQAFMYDRLIDIAEQAPRKLRLEMGPLAERLLQKTRLIA